MFPSRVTYHKDHIFKTKTTQPNILKSAIIYGANASGKSNLFKAVNFARKFIVEGSKNKNFIDVPVFKLNDSKNKSSSFIFEILAEGTNYEYGFEIQNSLVIKEWLKKVYKTSKETPIFIRKLDEQKIQVELFFSPTDEQKELVVKSTKAGLKNNQLFLTAINDKNEDNIETVFKTVYHWFSDKLQVIFPNSIDYGIHLGIMKEEALKDFFNKYLVALDTGIDKIGIKSAKLEDESITLPKEMKEDLKNKLDRENTLITICSLDGYERYWIERKKNEFIAHKLIALHLNKQKEEIEFDFREESDGTNRIFNLIPALSLLISSNKTVLIDEIDRSLHSLIPEKIFEYFFSETKSKESQLIASTHDLKLMDLDTFRRDEIWFIRKNQFAESELYSLEEFKTRFDKQLVTSYLSGAYGAIPILD